MMSTEQLVRDIMNMMGFDKIRIVKRNMIHFLLESPNVDQDTIFLRNLNQKDPSSIVDGVFQVGLYFSWMKMNNKEKNSILFLDHFRLPLIIGYFFYFLLQIVLSMLFDLGIVHIPGVIWNAAKIINVTLLIVALIVEYKYWKRVSPIYEDSTQEAIRVFNHYMEMKKEAVSFDDKDVRKKLNEKNEFWKIRNQYPVFFRTPITVLFLMGLGISF